MAAVVLSSPTDSDEIRADKSETTESGGVTERVYRGAVSAELKNSLIASDSAVVRTGSAVYHFYSDVRFEDGGYRVFADRLTFDASSQIATLLGDVRLSDGARSIEAERAVFRVDARSVEASGRVRTRQADSGVSVSADRWFYSGATDSSAGRGNVVYVGRSVTIRSEQFYGSSGDRARFTDDVLIESGPWSAESGDADFADSTLTLFDSPSASRSESDSTSFSLAASEIRLTFDDSVLSGLSARGAVQMTTQGSDDDSLATSSVMADSCYITDGEGATTLDAFGKVTVELNRAGISTSKVSGDTTRIVLSGGEPERIGVPGKGALKHERVDGRILATVTGHYMEIELAIDELRGIKVDSNAVAELEGEDPIKLSGDHLILGFRDGKLMRAEVTGAVKGQYKPQVAGENP